ncbi:hypothetical protein ACFE04_030534 [Oxalis oulophora]
MIDLVNIYDSTLEQFHPNSTRNMYSLEESVPSSLLDYIPRDFKVPMEFTEEEMFIAPELIYIVNDYQDWSVSSMMSICITSLICPLGSMTHFDPIAPPLIAGQSSTRQSHAHGSNAFTPAWGLTWMDFVINSPRIAIEYIEHVVPRMDVSCTRCLIITQLYTKGSHVMARVVSSFLYLFLKLNFIFLLHPHQSVVYYYDDIHRATEMEGLPVDLKEKFDTKRDKVSQANEAIT